MAEMVAKIDRTEEEAVGQTKAEEERPAESNDAQGLAQRLDELIRDEYDYSRPRRGEVRDGVILAIGENDIVVDLGVKRDGIVPPRDLDRLDEDFVEGLEIGEHVPVVVLRTWGQEDEVVVSINQGLQRQDWLQAEEMVDSGEVFEGEVVDYNKGGVLVPFGRVRGFVPNSHLTSIPRGMRGDRLRKAKSELVGEVLSLAVIEVNQRRRRLVLSEREAQHRRREELLKELTAGDVRTGVVTNLVDFGAFVDLGGVDGLVHISELDWQHVARPSDVLDVGDEVQVYVLSVDREKERIALSRKRLLPDPWYAVTDNLELGQVVEGTVTNVVDFGAFVDVGRGVEGLVHISEMPSGKDSLSTLKGDQTIAVRVLDIDLERRRISLSMRRIEYAAAILSEESTPAQSEQGETIDLESDRS